MLSNNNLSKWGAVTLLIILFVLFGFSIVLLMGGKIGESIVLLGLGLTVLGYGSLYLLMQTSVKAADPTVGIYSLAAARYLIIAGLIMIVLGFLNLMHILPYNNPI